MEDAPMDLENSDEDTNDDLANYEFPEPICNVNVKNNKAVIKDFERWIRVFTPINLNFYMPLIRNPLTVQTAVHFAVNLDILCMPMKNSPILVAFKGKEGAHEFTSSLAILLELTYIQMYIKEISDTRVPGYRYMEEKAEEEKQLLVIKKRKTLKKLKKNQNAYQDKRKSEKQAIFDFLQILEKHTIDVIHVIEKFVWEILVEACDREIPLSKCLSSNEALDASVLIAQDIDKWQQLIHTNQHFFKLKNAIAQEFKVTQQLSYETLPQDILSAMQASKDIYKSYMCFKTAKEYFLFIGCLLD